MTTQSEVSSMTPHLLIFVVTLLLAAASSAPAVHAGQAAPTAEQRVTALKQSLQESQTRLKQYEWIETTIISLKGEEKARKQQRCYYGADGKVQKIPIGDAAPKAQPESAGGRRGGRVKAQIIENKKDDMKEYMERAASLIHQYVPPAPAQIQKVKDAGHVAVTPGGQGLIRVELTDYLQAGDKMAIDINSAANSLAALSLSTYLDKVEDTVSLDVRYRAPADGKN